jgi:hypothetical protein
MGRFELRGSGIARLLGDGDRVLLTAAHAGSRLDAKAWSASVRLCAQFTHRIDFRRVRHGWCYALRDMSGRVLGTSPAFPSETDCHRAAETMRRTAPNTCRICWTPRPSGSSSIVVDVAPDGGEEPQRLGYLGLARWYATAVSAAARGPSPR